MNDGKQFNLNADTEDSNMMTQRSDPSKEPAPDTNTTATEPTTNNNITATQPAAGGEDASATDDPMLNRYRNGFKVAINYLYHHHDDADKEKFKAFLETHIPAEHVAEVAVRAEDVLGRVRRAAQQVDARCGPSGHARLGAEQ